MSGIPSTAVGAPPSGPRRRWPYVAGFAVGAVAVGVLTLLGLRALFPSWSGAGHEGAHAVTPGGTTLGVPADPAEADQTVRISATDDLRYSPSTIPVAVGEVVAFEITNDGASRHEFFLADAVYQQAHETEMAQGGEHVMPDSPYAVSLEPGETKTITWRFTDAGATEFACHIPGHYAGGMLGSIVVS
ncbi:MAG: cupredoxin domain-containing protein [Actinomycetota bacterium]